MFACIVGTATSCTWESNKGGSYPRDAIKGDIPDVAETKELCSYLLILQGRNTLQGEGCRAETVDGKPRRGSLPLWGWSRKIFRPERWTMVPFPTQHPWGSRTSGRHAVWGMPPFWLPNGAWRKTQHEWPWRNGWRIFVCLLEEGRPVTKSTAMCDNGWRGIGKGLSRPPGGWCGVFPRAHTEQAATKDLVSWTMEIHHNRCWRRCRVREKPGWQASRDEWSHCRALGFTNPLFHLPGHRTDNARGRKDGAGLCHWRVCRNLARQSIQFHVPRTRAVGEDEVETTQEHSPSCLTGVNPSCAVQVGFCGLSIPRNGAQNPLTSAATPAAGAPPPAAFDSPRHSWQGWRSAPRHPAATASCRRHFWAIDLHHKLATGIWVGENEGER